MDSSEVEKRGGSKKKWGNWRESKGDANGDREDGKENGKIEGYVVGSVYLKLYLGGWIMVSQLWLRIIEVWLDDGEERRGRIKRDYK